MTCFSAHFSLSLSDSVRLDLQAHNKYSVRFYGFVIATMHETKQNRKINVEIECEQILIPETRRESIPFI